MVETVDFLRTMVLPGTGTGNKPKTGNAKGMKKKAV
jgi:hypothetical protein